MKLMKKKSRSGKKDFNFDYKDPVTLYDFIEGAKISASRTNGLSKAQQKQLSNAIKKARNLGLLPSHHQAFDDFSRPTPVSPKPFSYK